MSFERRKQILETLRQELEPEPAVLAMWLEGADAVGAVDEFSDIDVCCSVTAGAMAAVTDLARRALERLGPLDLAQRLMDEEDAQTTVFHLEGASPYLLVDFSVYVGRGSSFVRGDEIEKPLVWFDRGGVITYRDLVLEDRSERRQRLQETVAQAARIEKYVRRGDFLEALGYYQKWLLTPLIEALRMVYTPLHPDYYIVHISRHLPVEVRLRLEDLFKVNSVAEIGRKSQAALEFFDETIRAIVD